MKNYLEIIPESIQLIKMTDEEYFSEKYKDYISNSKLSLIDPTAGGSPEKYLEGFKGSYNESFELGTDKWLLIKMKNKWRQHNKCKKN